MAFSVALATTAHAASIFHTDPPPIVSNPNPDLTVLYKELGGYPNYGVSDGRADVLYSTESDIWIFDLSSLPITGSIVSAKVRLSLVLDDHYVRPETDYVGRIFLNGSEVFSGGFADLGIEHGTPFGSIFVNWKQIEFSIVDLSPSAYTVHIMNDTSGSVFGDWIAIDYIELELKTRTMIQIDIKPGSFPNSINPRSEGVIPVAILTTDTFDATTVDPTTVLFGATGTEAAPVHSALEDVDLNGDTDMILHFNIQDTGIQCGDTSASLTGETLDGQIIEGSDSIKTVGCK